MLREKKKSERGGTEWRILLLGALGKGGGGWLVVVAGWGADLAFLCLFACLFVGVFLGGSPATRPGRPALGDPPLVLIALWRVYGMRIS